MIKNGSMNDFFFFFLDVFMEMILMPSDSVYTENLRAIYTLD